MQKHNTLFYYTSGGGMLGNCELAFCKALICKSARKGARHIGQLLAW